MFQIIRIIICEHVDPIMVQMNSIITHMVIVINVGVVYKMIIIRLTKMLQEVIDV